MSSEVSRGFITVKLYNYLRLIIQTDSLHKQLIKSTEKGSVVDDHNCGLVHHTLLFLSPAT